VFAAFQSLDGAEAGDDSVDPARGEAGVGIEGVQELLVGLDVSGLWCELVLFVVQDGLLRQTWFDGGPAGFVGVSNGQTEDREDVRRQA
jgi:hypothetical protein